VCRICHCEQTRPKIDPLISPCNCTGFLKYVHFKCLQTWIGSDKLDIRNRYVGNTVYHKSGCEICNSAYPEVVQVNEKTFEMFPVAYTPSAPYVKLQVMGLFQGKNIKMVSFEHTDQITIGRCPSNFMNIKDSSIS
jgi:hypothetical protein